MNCIKLMIMLKTIIKFTYERNSKNTREHTLTHDRSYRNTCCTKSTRLQRLFGTHFEYYNVQFTHTTECNRKSEPSVHSHNRVQQKESSDTVWAQQMPVVTKRLFVSLTEISVRNLLNARTKSLLGLHTSVQKKVELPWCYCNNEWHEYRPNIQKDKIFNENLILRWQTKKWPNVKYVTKWPNAFFHGQRS